MRHRSLSETALTGHPLGVLSEDFAMQDLGRGDRSRYWWPLALNPFQSVNRNVNTFERLPREGVDRGPFDARILRTQGRGKNQEESEAPHLTEYKTKVRQATHSSLRGAVSSRTASALITRELLAFTDGAPGRGYTPT